MLYICCKSTEKLYFTQTFTNSIQFYLYMNKIALQLPRGVLSSKVKTITIREKWPKSACSDLVVFFT